MLYLAVFGALMPLDGGWGLSNHSNHLIVLQDPSLPTPLSRG